MKKYIHIVWFLIIGVLVLTACTPVSGAQTQATTAQPKTPTSTPPPEVTPTEIPQPTQGLPVKVTEADMGKDIHLNIGNFLIITLEGNPSTGYNWEVQPDANAVIEQVGGAEFKANSNLMGAPGMIAITLKASKTGQQMLNLVYHRSFEKDVPPVKVFTLNVIVETPGSSQAGIPTTLATFRITQTTVVNPTNGWKGWQTYTNAVYGFSFQYPPNWRLVEVTDDKNALRGHAVQLYPNNNESDVMFQVAFKHASEDLIITRFGVGAGDLIKDGQVSFLGRLLIREVLVFQGKDMTVLYLEPGNNGQEVQFCISLDFHGSYFSSPGLSQAVESDADNIVASFKMIE